MSRRIWSQLLIFLNHARRISAVAPRFSGVGLLLLLICHGASASAGDTKEKDAIQPCAFDDSGFDPSANVHALEEYQHVIADLLKQDKFTELDCVADSVRASKAQFPGGTWKLHKIYSGLDEPQPGHATEEDWRKHMERLDRWVELEPRSITAQIALAKSYVGYAWEARGTGFSDDVSGSGWKLFSQRLEKARTVLDYASALHTQCPEWYVAMQQVALGQGWNLARATALFDQAVAFEPTYEFYYRMQAHYLLPKWNGRDGDASQFAEQAADHMGGKAGDILYSQIATEIICPCPDPEFGHMSWPRLQKAFEELQAQYGESLLNWNLLALMAFKANDSVAADAAFKHVGDNWDKDTWKTAEWFNQNKSWAAQLAPIEAHSRAIKQEAKANLQTAEGVSYKKNVEGRLAAIEQSCVQKSSNERDEFGFLILVGKDGVVQDAWMTSPSNTGRCLMGDLRDSHARKEAIFSPPPHDSYWVLLNLNPASFTSTAKVGK